MPDLLFHGYMPVAFMTSFRDLVVVCPFVVRRFYQRRRCSEISDMPEHKHVHIEHPRGRFACLLAQRASMDRAVFNRSLGFGYTVCIGELHAQAAFMAPLKSSECFSPFIVCFLGFVHMRSYVASSSGVSMGDAMEVTSCYQ